MLLFLEAVVTERLDRDEWVDVVSGSICLEFVMLRLSVEGDDGSFACSSFVLYLSLVVLS